MSSEGLSKRARDNKPEDDYHEAPTKPPVAKHTKGLKSLLIAVSVPLLLGVLDAFFFNPNQPFYQQLKKPFWNPPGWLFGLAWSLLYPTMGLASWLVWVEGGWKRQQHALGLYLLQLTLNLLWPAIFFGLHNLSLALIDIVALVIVLAVCINAFTPVNHVAGNLLKPYLAWVAFATLLNFSLLMMNKSK